MGHAFLLSLRQLGDRAVIGVLARSLAVTLAIFALLGVAWWYALGAALTWAGVADQDWASAAAIVAGIVSLWLGFRIVAIAVVGVFADDVVVAVERRHFPEMLAKARPIGLGRSAAMGLRSALRALAVNIAILPLYIALLVTGVGAPLVFFVANGWLLGRDLGDMVAVRHLNPAAIPAWRRTTRVSRFVLGAIVTALFLIPVAGLLAPVLGAAMATHLFHRKPA